MDRWVRELLVLACLGGLGLGFAWTTEGYEFFAPYSLRKSPLLDSPRAG